MKVITVNDQQYAVLSVLGKGGSSKVNTRIVSHQGTKFT